MQDNFEEAYQQVYSAFIKLCGGYYEPKSERDRLSAELLSLVLHKMDIVRGTKMVNNKTEYELLKLARWRESDGHPMNKSARELMKLWGEDYVF